MKPQEIPPYDERAERLGRVIQAHRLRLGMSAGRLALACDMAPSAFFSYEIGRAFPLIRTLLRIGEALDAPAWDMMREAFAEGAPARGAALNGEPSAVAQMYAVIDSTGRVIRVAQTAVGAAAAIAGNGLRNVRISRIEIRQIGRE